MRSNPHNFSRASIKAPKEDSHKGYMPTKKNASKKPVALICSFGTPWLDHLTDKGCQACDDFTNDPQGAFEWHTPAHPDDWRSAHAQEWLEDMPARDRDEGDGT